MHPISSWGSPSVGSRALAHLRCWSIGVSWGGCRPRHFGRIVERCTSGGCVQLQGSSEICAGQHFCLAERAQDCACNNASKAQPFAAVWTKERRQASAQASSSTDQAARDTFAFANFRYKPHRCGWQSKQCWCWEQWHKPAGSSRQKLAVSIWAGSYVDLWRWAVSELVFAWFALWNLGVLAIWHSWWMILNDSILRWIESFGRSSRQQQSDKRATCKKKLPVLELPIVLAELVSVQEVSNTLRFWLQCFHIRKFTFDPLVSLESGLSECNGVSRKGSAIGPSHQTWPAKDQSRSVLAECVLVSFFADQSPLIVWAFFLLRWKELWMVTHTTRWPWKSCSKKFQRKLKLIAYLGCTGQDSLELAWVAIPAVLALKFLYMPLLSREIVKV